MARPGRVVWTGLSLRAQVPGPAPEAPPQWCISMPDVFSIRNTTVEAYVEPVVHEIKVRRADLLGSVKHMPIVQLGGERRAFRIAIPAYTSCDRAAFTASPRGPRLRIIAFRKYAVGRRTGRG